MSFIIRKKKKIRNFIIGNILIKNESKYNIK